MIQLVEAEIQAKTRDVMGQLVGGYMKIRGWLKSTERFRFEISGGYTRLIPISAPYYIQVGFLFFDQELQYHPHELFCLPITEVKPNFGMHDTTKGLILQRTGLKDEYRRVGVFESSDSGFGESAISNPFTRPFYQARVRKDNTANIEPMDQVHSDVVTDNAEQSEQHGEHQSMLSSKRTDTIFEVPSNQGVDIEEYEWVESVITIV
jgi:hypothetical protein